MSRIKILSLLACVAVINAQSRDNAGRNSGSAGRPGKLTLEIIPKDPSIYGQVKRGSALQVHCNFNEEGDVWWMKGDDILTNRTHKYDMTSATLRIDSAKMQDSGDYVCLAETRNRLSMNKTIHVEVYDHRVMPGVKNEIARVNFSASLSCPIDENDINSSILEWKNPSAPNQILNGTTIRNGRQSEMILKFPRVSYENNGTYECGVKNGTGAYIRKGQRSLLVTGPPEIRLSAKGIGAHSVYLNWTIIEHNTPVARLTIEYTKEGGEGWITYPEEIDVKNPSSDLVWKGLDSGVGYRFRMNAYNSSNASLDLIFSDPIWTETLAKDYEYTPSFTVTERTNSSVTLEFQKVPTEFDGYFDYFNVSVTHGVNATEPEYLTSNDTTLTYELPEPNTVYKVKGAACSSYTHQCGNWSGEQVIESSSACLYPSGINLVAVIMASVYFSMKHLVA